ncbi:MAG: SlyX family protein [Gammaproteobacteria bacterium]|nr:SlyX family protein [Gammaproteobacteria bacterium]
MTDDRLIDLETKLAYQEDLLETLNGLVITQQARIETLENLCRGLADRVRQFKDTGQTADEQYEVPPHY